MSSPLEASADSSRLEWVAPAAAELMAAVRDRPPAPADAGVVVQDTSGQIVAANLTAGRLLGLSWDQLIGRTSMDPRWAAVSEEGLPLPGDQHPAMRALAAGSPVDAALMGILLPPASTSVAGLTRWIEVTAMPVLESGGPIGVVSWFRDASRTERAFAANEALLASYRLLSEAVPGLVLHVDEDWVVRDFAASGSPGVEDPLGRPLLDFIEQADREDAAEQLELAARGDRPVRFDCRWVGVPGDELWVGLQAQPITADGRFCGATVGLHDIDEAVRARRHLVEMSGELDRERARMEQAMAASGLGTWEWDIPPALFACDDRWAQMMGYEDALDLGTPGRDWWQAQIHPDDLAAVTEVVRRLAEGVSDRLELELRVRHRDGRWLWIRSVGQVSTRDETGAPLRVSGVGEDVTARVATQQALATSEEHYRLLAEHVTDAVWRVSPEGTIVWASESTRTLLGWEPREVVGRDALDFLPDDYREVGRSGREAVHLGQTVSAEGPLRCSDGSYRTVSLTARPARASDGVWEILAIRDIQGEVEAREELSRAALEDALTGRPNRAAALERLADSLADSGSAARTAVLVVGIDGLRTVNEAWSLSAGDRLIAEVGNRVEAALEGEFLARGPGDEFIVVVDDDQDPAGRGAILADHLRESVRRPLRIAEQALVPTVSVGIAVGSARDGAPDLLRDAGAALKRAKENGRDRHEFSDTRVAEQAQERLHTAELIRDGIREGNFAPWYQPIVALRSGRTVGYEALIRCRKEQCELQRPDDYLPVAEATGLIVDLDLIVLRQVADMLLHLPAPLFVAVNVSPRTLVAPVYAAELVALLDEHATLRGRLKLEVTETALMSITDDVLAVAEDLVARGVDLYADDFGTGYSSITHIRDLPIAGIKLDRSFTAGLSDADITAERLSRAMIGLADGMGLDSVAEGVETRQQAAILMAQGWRHAQGWLYGRPAPQPEIAASA